MVTLHFPVPFPQVPGQSVVLHAVSRLNVLQAAPVEIVPMLQVDEPMHCLVATPPAGQPVGVLAGVIVHE